MRRFALAVVVALLMTACGQNGDLFLPPTAMPERVPSAESTSDDNDNDNDNDNSATDPTASGNDDDNDEDESTG